MNRYDGFTNTVIGHGMRQRDPFSAYKFRPDNFIMSDQEADDLFTFNGIANKIISAPADEAMRAGFKLKDGESIIEHNDTINSIFEDLNGQGEFAKALAWDRLYGGAVMLMMIDDGLTLEEPLNEKKIRKVERLEVYEPMDVSFFDSYFYDNPHDSNYGRPQFYTITGYNGGSFLVHESRLLLFTGGVISNRRRRMRNGWGGRVFDKVQQDIVNYNTSLSLALMAISRLSQGILKLEGLSSQLASDFGEQQVQKRLQLIDMARHLMNTIAIDRADEYDQKNLTTAGLKDVMQEFQVALSASTDMPATILFGRSPAGQNATGHSDFENYYNMIGRIQQRTLRPQLARFLSIIDKASDYGITLPNDYTIEFNPLWSPSEKEKAETANINAQAGKNNAESRKIYKDIGALDNSEIRNAIASDGKYELDRSLDKLLDDEPLEN